uniref:U-box domain-containing protein n=1 Tax=Sphenodon punctatus TaxID=8508 RepID=A0A8D0HEW5_SPHPU
MKMLTDHPFANTAIQNWHKTQKNLKISLEESPYTPITTQTLDKDNVAKELRKLLNKHDIHRAEQLFKNEQFITIQELQQLTKKKIDTLQYLQIKNIFTDRNKIQQYSRRPTQIEKTLLNHSTNKGLIAKIYRALIEADSNNPNSYIKKWEQELGKTFDDKQIETIVKQMHNCASSLEIKETQIKVILRYYLTPIQFKKIDGTGLDRCWRDCGEQGTYLHCWWYCPKVQHLWNRIWLKMKKATGLIIPFRPEIALLGLYPDIPLMNHHRETCTLMTLAGLNIIARNWKTAKNLTENEWTKRLWYMYTMEKITSTQEKKTKNHTTRWFACIESIQGYTIEEETKSYLVDYNI